MLPKKRYCAAHTDEKVVYSLLEDKVQGRMTWSAWSHHRKCANLPVLRKPMQQLSIALLLDEPHPLKFQSHKKGAFFEIAEIFARVVEMNYFDGRLLPHAVGSEPLLWKISYDNRYIFGNKNEGYFIQPLSVDDPQSPSHVTTVALHEGREMNENLRKAFTEMRFNDFLSDLPHLRMEIDEKYLHFDFIVCADWIGITRELGVDAPNAKSPDAETCWCCSITKGVLKTSWWQEPWKYHCMTNSINDFPNAVLWAVPLDKRRYCWMHGVTRMISTALLEFHSLLSTLGGQKNAWKAMIRTVVPEWEPNPKKGALQAKQMKSFIRNFNKKLLSTILESIPNASQVKPILWPDEPNSLVLPLFQQFEMVIDAIRVYHDFAYRKHPQRQDFITLWHARTVILGFWAANQLFLPPVMHFMTNEGIAFAVQDNTAYTTLQEAIEHQNSIDKADMEFTNGQNSVGIVSDSAFQQMLIHQHLGRRLIPTRPSSLSHGVLALNNHEEPIKPVLAAPQLVDGIQSFLCSLPRQPLFSPSPMGT
jgi:hypothetical protein